MNLFPKLATRVGSMAPACRIAITLVMLVACSGLSRADEAVVGYDQVKEILRKRCVTCHNPDEMRGDLDLKDLAAIQAGSASGPVVVAKNSSASLLYTTLAHLEDPVMPPNSPRIPEREQDLIRRWIDGGLLEKSNAESAPTGSNSSVPSNQRLAAIRALPQASAVTCLQMHPHQNIVAVPGLRQVVLLDPTTQQFLGAIEVPGDVTALRFSADGKLLMVAVSQPAVSGFVVALDVDSWNEVWKHADETDSILAMDLSVDGDLLAVAGSAKVVRLIDTKTGQTVHSLKKHTDWILDLRFSPDGLLLASSDRFGSSLVWEPKSGNLFQNLKDHVGAVYAISWDLTSDTLISGGHDGILRTWNLHHGQLTSRWDGQVGPILAIARTKEFFAATGRKNLVSIWRSADSPLAKLELKDQGESLCAQQDGQLLIVGDASGQISILNSQDFQRSHQLALPVDNHSMAQMLAGIEAKHLAYTAEAKRVAKEVKSDHRKNDPPVTPPNQLDIPSLSSTQPRVEANALKIQESSLQLDDHQRLLEQSRSLLQASNQTLAELTQLNDELIHMLTRSAKIQQQMAQQIAEQSKQLELLQSAGKAKPESAR